MRDSDFNFFYLLAGLCGPLFLAPIAEDVLPLDTRIVVAGSFMLLFLVSLGAARRTARGRATDSLLAAVGVVATGSLIFVESNLVQTLMVGVMLAYVGSVVSRAVNEVVFKGGTVNANYLAGAVAVYLQFAVIMACVYHFIDIAVQGAFSGLRAGSAQVLDLLYYSLITQTTVGYGEIVPTMATTRALATLQAVLGQFYIAVIVATLVSRWLQQSSSGESS